MSDDTDGSGDGGDATLSDLRTVADYQFGAGAGRALFPDDDLTVKRSTSGRPRQVLGDESRVVSYGTDGRFTLGVEGGRRLVEQFPAPANRVAVGAESEPFVRDGKNAFAKFVTEVDPAVRPGDEVAVVTTDDDVLGVGRAELSADAMDDFQSGMAVFVRHGAGER
ncbi:PUA domain-containing protein [Halogeometricum luteum]|uniref:Pseudouridine synthase n=1 Tax=Halogeometricum luteum TaxID=2950537 RepID=A0ABU2FXY7_9EURY|nr:PUA domain-containing protein [Halogeometricum sp. S3BR5-2]MDS0293375.1 pseudouridine synthase [Halogeometricum sp. S3BR5-2]